MLRRRSIFFAAMLLVAGSAVAQVPSIPQTLPTQSASQAVPTSAVGGAASADNKDRSGMKWRIAGHGDADQRHATGTGHSAADGPSAAQPADRPTVGTTGRHARAATGSCSNRARVSAGPGTLPSDAGQEWREYDITPYTARVTSTNRPEQAILDWILRETGYEAWHTQPLAILSIDSRRLSVYHTPQMHAVVQGVVDRFVNSEAESHVFGMRVVTLRSPDWRAKHHKVLHAVATQSQGIQAWLLAKEDAALLVADLRRRSDFQEHSTPHLMVNNGQSKQISATQSRNYMRNVILRPETGWPGFEPQLGQFDEGFKLEFSPLLSIDGAVVDAVIRCDVDQVEKMLPVMIDVPTAAAPRQRQKIEVPQAVGTRLHERFRWPTEQVLLVSLGMGPAPVPDASGGISVPLLSGPPRAEMLIFVESRGAVGSQPTALQPGQREASLYQNRY